MTIHVRTLRKTCRQLRLLEDAIVAQRQVITNLEASNRDSAEARRALSRLLQMLDEQLDASRLATHA